MSSGLYNTHKIDFDTTLDLTRLKPYGDTMNDGKVQTSFTLPIKDDERGEEAARQIAKKMGLDEPNVAYHTPLDKEFTFYVVYGSCVHSVNYEDIHVITVESDVMSRCLFGSDNRFLCHFSSSLLFVVLPKNRIPSIFSFIIIALLAGKYKRRLDNFFTNEQIHRRNSHTVRNVKNGYLETRPDGHRNSGRLA